MKKLLAIKLALLLCLSTVNAMVQTSGAGHFMIPTAPAAGTSVTSGAANTFTTTAVQMTASTGAAIYITALTVQLSSTSVPTYVEVNIGTGSAPETTVDQEVLPIAFDSGLTGTKVMARVDIYPPIPVANATRIAVKTADSLGALAWLITLTCINQSNVVAASSTNETVNVVQWNTANVSSPSTAGIPDVNVKNMNNVAATSITTINANQGTTQPVNYTGTGSSALVKGDVTDIATAAVSASTAQLGVNVVNWAGGAAPAPNVTGVPIVDAKYLLGTIFSTPATAGIMDINLKNIANAAVSTSTAQLGTNLVNVAGSAVSTSTAQLGVNVVNYNGNAVSASTNGIPDVNMVRINNGLTTGANATLKLAGLVITAPSDTDAIVATGGAASGVKGGAGLRFQGGAATGALPAGPGISAKGGLAGNNAAALSGDGITLIGNDALGSGSGGVGLRISGGAASTSAAGAPAVSLTGGAGAASGNGASAGLVSTGGGTTTVSGNDGVIFTGTGNGNGLTAAKSGTGQDINATLLAVTTATTATNLTNAPTAGDFTATMKTSLNAATPTVSLGTNAPSGWINAAAIAASALNGKGDWLLSSSYTAPPSAATIASATWQDTTAGDFTNSASIGKSVMNGVSLGTGLTINGYTGNTPQTGDAYARIGAAGAGLTAIGDTRMADLDAAVSSRMATYTQPTGFLSATFPSGTIANTTNVTAGTITTTTNLTNLPSIPANWLTSAGINAGALNGKGDWLLASSYTSPPSAATITTTLWQDLTSSSDFTTSGSIGKLLVTDINGTITSRMATFSLPSNFSSLAIDGSGDVTFNNSSIGTVTNLTNLPSIPANWLTATGIAAAALNGKGDWNIGKTGYSLTQAFPTNFALLAIDGSGDVTYNNVPIDIWNVTLPASYTGQTAGHLLWKIGNKP
jgi:hypothetical protein